MAVQSATPIDYEVKDSKGNIKLLGKTTRQRLAQPPFDSWFTKNYNAYTPDTNTAVQLKPLIRHKKFLIFMGTWCGDSRREVPRIYKLLDCCGVQPAQVQLVNVDNADTAYKQSPGHEEKGLNIRRVPTLLIYENNHELGRVIESPVVLWEKDLLAILKHEAYVPRYSDLRH
jgi:thiol-disulfide isomerase/thioredoxin